MTTIYDIAKYTGLSPATVSRVLSGKKTNEANRQKVLDAAKELNYHNMAYTNTQGGYRPVRGKATDTHTILLVPGRNGCDGVYAAARELGYSIQLISSLSRSEQYVRSQLNSGAALGLLTHESSFSDFKYDIALHYPTVIIGYGGIGTPGNSVWIDLENALLSLFQELRIAGCKRIWTYTSETQNLVLRPLLDHISDFGLEELRNITLTKTFFSQAFGDHLALVEEITALPPEERPDGLILPNSVVASCFVNMMRMRGISVPEDMAIVSLIGGEHDCACEPYITSILPPYYELGYEAVRVLDSLISGKICPKNIRYPHKMHYGGSTRKELGSFGELIE